MAEQELTFNKFQMINLERHEDWPRAEDRGDVSDWSLSDWGVAIAEETGELCGAIKRLNRFRAGYVIKRRKSQVQSEAEGAAKIKEEIGGIFVYLTLLLSELGIPVEDCIRDTFNEVSEREGLPHRL